VESKLLGETLSNNSIPENSQKSNPSDEISSKNSSDGSTRAAKNIYEWKKDYGNTSSTRPNSIVKELWSGYGNNSINGSSLQNGREPSENDRHDNSSVRRKGEVTEQDIHGAWRAKATGWRRWPTGCPCRSSGGPRR